MKYFTQDYLDFFKELAANNHKEWFDENRKRYEKSVKDPFKKFVEALIAETHKFDPSVNIEAKDAIFRINRDIRFSKDKTPYKLDRSAIISSGGRKDHSIPGFYIATGFSGHGFGIGPGAGKSIATMLMGKEQSIDLSPFKLRRFFDGSKIQPQSTI